MGRFPCAVVIFSGCLCALASRPPSDGLHPLTVDYPADESVFPPEMTAPVFLWRDDVETATGWMIDVTFDDGSPAIHVNSRGERMRIGEIDPRCVAQTNELPKLTPQQAAAHTWKPDENTWAAIKKHSVAHPATVMITGFSVANPNQPVSRGRVTIRTSNDPVGAPIFYRDVPLMPSELQKGVIKPLAPAAVPLISWRLRDVSEPRSRLVMEGLHTCANCHSFSRDGKTMGMDVDGPQNDKGTYAIVPVSPQISIRDKDVLTWNSFPGKPRGSTTVGFLAQVSPDGQNAVVTLNEEVYVENFKDYRFLQVFYPTRGILAWHSRATGQMKALPGADDPRYVQTDGVWTPDGKWIIFARAEAKSAYPEGSKAAQYAGDRSETQIQYDLYRIPFNEGRGGRPEPIAGASRNGMSNTFPKVSPDGRWIVFVQCRNGQLMRPDSQLYIVPAQGGEARRMQCNTSLMNSWHSFSPNGRWLVFSSKSRSPYTQMFLTHLDEEGRDSPAILIDDATAANRAVNIPEFVNIPRNGLVKIEVPAAEFYRLYDHAMELADAGQADAAIAEWQKALKIDPDNANAHNNLGVLLVRKGALGEAVASFRRAAELKPGFIEAQHNLGGALAEMGELDQAIGCWRRVLELEPQSPEAYYNLGAALERKRKPDEAIPYFERALALNPGYVRARCDLGKVLYSQGSIESALSQWRRGLHLAPNSLVLLTTTAWALATCPIASNRNGAEAVELAERAVRLSGGREPGSLDALGAAYGEVGRFSEAVQAARRAVIVASRQNNQSLVEAVKARIALYEAQTPFRQAE